MDEFSARNKCLPLFSVPVAIFFSGLCEYSLRPGKCISRCVTSASVTALSEFASNT